MNVVGIVLCGGRSSRMGAPKAWLPFGGELMLPRVVRIVREAVGQVIVVAAPGQDVPPLADVRTVRDEIEGRGPLGGLAAGLAAMEGTADAVYLSSCDVPLLKPEFVRRVMEVMEEPNPPAPFPPREGGAGQSPLSPWGRGLGEGLPFAAVPFIANRFHPLAAAYHLSVLPVVREMLAANCLRMTGLLDRVSARIIAPEDFADIDPQCLSLRNINTSDEYEVAKRVIEFPSVE